AGTWTALPAGTDHGGGWVPAPADDGTIDLAHAAPSAPPDVASAFAAALRDLPRLLPHHGYHPAGLPDLRARIAERYAGRGLPTTPEEVLVTAGALHGVAVALETFLRRGDRLLVEHPTYPNALDAARARGARLLPVALDGAFPDQWISDVERAVAELRPAAAYVMPDFQNPTGTVLDTAQRDGLARALRRPGTIAIVDETLVELGLDTTAGPPLAAFDPRHVSVGTLSKVFWGGMRVGWIRAEADVVRVLTAVAVRSHMSGPAVEQLAACHLLDGAGAALDDQRDRLRARRTALSAALRHRLPAWDWHEPAGGLVLWCHLPSTRSTALVAAAEPLGLRLAAGPRFGTGHAFDDRLRLPYTQPPDVLRQAVDLLVEADARATVTAGPVDPHPFDAVV
ncbi:MAG: pyridoxal phosphate-dependent aminotransferase, partial [Actinomycetota bacterium]|nr:pyridoxal phosphate-dependent aminotransferase [Actinomycetota bacterium]